MKRQYFKLLGRGHKIFRTYGIDICNVHTKSTDTVLMKFDQNVWAPIDIDSKKLYDEMCDAFASALFSIPPPTTYRHTTVHGLKKMLNDFLTKLKLG